MLKLFYARSLGGGFLSLINMFDAIQQGLFGRIHLMIKPLFAIFIASGILLSACQGLPRQQMAARIETSASPSFRHSSALQGIWVDKKGQQANLQDISNCSLQAKITTKQLMATEAPANGILDTLKGMYTEDMEESKLQRDCMLSRGYIQAKMPTDE